MSAPFYELTGRLAEFDALQERLREAPRLLVISAVPRSGVSRLLAQFDETAAATLVLVDARPCRDQLDLAMQIADAAIAHLQPAAAVWWQSTSPPTDAPGLRLARTLSENGIDLDGLRFGAGSPADRLTDAFRLTQTLFGTRPGTIVVDHFGELLSGLTASAVRGLLGDLRILVQRHDTAALVLVESPDGPVAAALADPEHPLFRAGQQFVVARAEPARFVSDLAITRPSLPHGVTAALIAAVAELTEGVPDLVWRTLELSCRDGEPVGAAAEGWRRLQRAAEASLASEWGLLRRVHPHAQTVAAALAFDLAPTSALANPRSASDALARLRAIGVTWQPQPRMWALSDPLLTAWIQGHPPPWALRMRVARKSGGARARARAPST